MTLRHNFNSQSRASNSFFIFRRINDFSSCTTTTQQTNEIFISNKSNFFINKQICQLNYSNKIREMEILVVATRITTNNFWIYCGLPSARSSYRNRRWHLFNEKVATRRIKFCRKKLCRWRMGSGLKYNWDQTNVVDVI